MMHFVSRPHGGGRRAHQASLKNLFLAQIFFLIAVCRQKVLQQLKSDVPRNLSPILWIFRIDIMSEIASIVPPTRPNPSHRATHGSSKPSSMMPIMTNVSRSSDELRRIAEFLRIFVSKSPAFWPPTGSIMPPTGPDTNERSSINLIGKRVEELRRIKDVRQKN